MTRQTNPFQRMIAAVERRLAQEGVVVRESAELPERTSGALREIDVLVKGRLGEHEVSVAVECRDHASPQDVTWIDELAGKYRDLSVHAVIAVSSSGFTKAASEKAASLNIRTVSFAASDSQDVAVPIFRFMYQTLTLVGGQVRLEPPFTDLPAGHASDSLLYSADGAPRGTLGALLNQFFNSDARDATLQHTQARVPELLIASQSTALEVTIPYAGSGLFLKGPDGSMHEVTMFACRVHVQLTVHEGLVRTAAYGRHRVFLGDGAHENQARVSVALIQPPAANQLHIAWLEVDGKPAAPLAFPPTATPPN